MYLEMFRYESFWKLMVGLCVTYVVNCSDSFEHRHSLQLWTKVAFDWLQQELCTTCSLPGSSNDVRLYAALPTHLGITLQFNDTGLSLLLY